MVENIQVDGAQLGLPFVVHAGAIYYLPGMFDQAGLNYPPEEYGQPYVWPNVLIPAHTIYDVGFCCALDATP